MGRRASCARVVAWALWSGIAGAGLAVAGDEAAAVGSAVPPGMRAHVDPRTGRLRETPPAAAPAGAVPPAQSRSAVGLAETRAPGGGVMLDLQGRFQSPLVATLAPDGTLRVQHAGDGE